MLNKFALLILTLIVVFNENEFRVLKNLQGSSVVINRPKINRTDAINNDHLRRKRYLGLSKRFKLNRRYQECLGPGDTLGHCKHLPFCPMDVLGKTKQALDYLCIIEKTHVGVCCPDDIILDNLPGSLLLFDLPAGGTDYDDDDSKGCGILSKEATLKNSSTQEWPWIAALYKPNSGEQHFCGGSLITDRHVLTAAHCTTGLTAKDIRVRLGEYDFKQINETRSRDFGVSKIINHEEFYLPTYTNDIAIVVLDRPTSFDSYIWPICLPPINRSYEGETVIVAGWGQKFYAGPTSEVLLQVEIPIWSLEKCIDSFLQRITEDNLCAAAYEGGKDSCLGDSGGPLLYRLSNKRWIAAGIVSWGIGCGQKGKPGIYTRVDKYLPWIIKNSMVK